MRSGRPWSWRWSARYEAKRARRQFDAVEPENRLRAGELEARWNHALEEVAALEMRTVIELVSELAKICPDKNSAAILNRLGYKTGQEKTWNSSRVAGLRGYHEIEPFQRQEGWVTQEQAARELNVSNTVVKRLIREQGLPATQIADYAPWVIKQKDLSLPAVQRQVQAIHSGRKLPLTVPNQQQFSLE